MQRLDIQPTQSTPLIAGDDRLLKIWGESYPENSFEFYTPVIEWVKQRLAAQPELQIDINVSYMNSSSTKCMLDLLDLLEQAHKEGGRISITWRYDTDNPRSLDLAEEFQEEVTLPFSIVPLEA